MKKLTLILLFGFLGLGLAFQSCEPETLDGTDNLCLTDCGDNGSCNDGVCVCNNGYEGEDCFTKWTAKFEGSYIAVDTCGIEEIESVVLSNFDELAVIDISNFAGFALDIQADLVGPRDIQLRTQTYNVSGSGITVPPDFVEEAEEINISGEGYLSEDDLTLTIDYIVIYEPNTFNEYTEVCQVIYEK